MYNLYRDIHTSRSVAYTYCCKGFPILPGLRKRVQLRKTATIAVVHVPSTIGNFKTELLCRAHLGKLL